MAQALPTTIPARDSLVERIRYDERAIESLRDKVGGLSNMHMDNWLHMMTKVTALESEMSSIKELVEKISEDAAAAKKKAQEALSFVMNAASLSDFLDDDENEEDDEYTGSDNESVQYVATFNNNKRRRV